MKRNNLKTLGYILAALVFAVAMVACTDDLQEPTDKDPIEDTNQPADEPSDTETPSDTEEPSDTETPSDQETPEDSSEPADSQIETVKTLLMSTKWSVSDLYCLEEGGYAQPAAYYGDAILFLDDNKLAYEDGGDAGFVYCDLNGWDYPYEDLVPTGSESWDVVEEDGKCYIQFSNGGFPLIVVDESNIDCKCEIISTAEASFQLKVVAETWEDGYAYQVTYVPTNEIPEKPEDPGQDEPVVPEDPGQDEPVAPEDPDQDEVVVPESWAEGYWYHYFGEPTFGLTQDVFTSFADLTNPTELTGATWTLSDPGVNVIKYEGCFSVGDYENQILEFTLSTNSFPGTVNLVCINYSTDEVPVTVSCTVGGVELPSAESDWAAAFAGEGTGEVVIKFTPEGSGGAIYFDELYFEGTQN